MTNDRLLDVVADLYDAATDLVRLRTIGPLISRALGSESSLVFTARGSAELHELISASDNFDEAARVAYRDYYSYRNEWFLRGARLPPPTVVCGGELIGYAAFDRTEFCTDWCKRVGIYHLLAATFPVNGELMGAIGIHRQRSAVSFEDAEKRILSVIAPHLMRAIQIGHKLGTVQATVDLTLDMLHGLAIGLLLVDHECRPLFMNAVAERAVTSARWLTVSGRRIRPVSRAQAGHFERAVASACATSAGKGLGAGAILRVVESSAQSIAVLIAPFRNKWLEFGAQQQAAIILFSEPGNVASARSIAKAHGLTPGESGLVASLASGRSLPAHARWRGISVNTAKAQLRSVFLKTGYTRQTDLIAAVLADPVLKLEHGAPELAPWSDPGEGL